MQDAQVISLNAAGAPSWRLAGHVSPWIEADTVHPAVRRADILMLQEAALSDEEALTV